MNQKYDEAMDELSGRERVERTLSLFGSICEMFRLQANREWPHLTPMAMRIKIAERLYQSDLGIQNLLERAREI